MASAVRFDAHIATAEGKASQVAWRVYREQFIPFNPTSAPLLRCEALDDDDLGSDLEGFDSDDANHFLDDELDEIPADDLCQEEDSSALEFDQQDVIFEGQIQVSSSLKALTCC